MNKALLVARREYAENLRTKTFWLGIAFVPVLLVLAILVPMWLDKKKDVRKYEVLDHSGWLRARVEERAASPGLEKVLKSAIAAHRDDPERLERFPESIKKMAPLLAEHEEHVGTIAKQFAQLEFSGLASLKLPAAIEEKISKAVTEEREKLRKWWKSLPPEEAKAFAPDLSKSRYVRVDVEPATEEELNTRLNDGELFAYFVINKDPVEDEEGCKYVSNNLSDDSLRRWYTNLASAEVRARRLTKKGIDEVVASWIERPLEFESKKISAVGEEEKVEEQDRASHIAPIVFVYLLWVAVFTIAQMLLTSTIEEKSTRIIEVLLSSVSPTQLMAGKIVGLAATGLTVVSSWVIFFVVVLKTMPFFVDTMPDLDFAAIIGNPAYLGPFVAYFLLGYLLYAAIFVGLGSCCNSLKEAQNLMMPVVLVLIVPIFAMVPVGQDPNGSLARLLSFIPPFTPFVMMNRAAGPPSTWEYVVTTLLLVISIGVAFWGAGKIFRVGILMTGKPPRPLEIIRIVLSRTA